MEIGHAALLRLTRRARDETPGYHRCAIKTSKETVSQLSGRFTTATQVPEVKVNLVSQGRFGKEVRSGARRLSSQTT
jgi:hypothetical protein